MCGIFGWISRQDRCPGLSELKRLTDLLVHRGPDGSGYQLLSCCNGMYSIGLGHRRLSIVDLSEAGAQPMWSSDGALCLIYNGELYNFIELREQLLNLGYKFSSSSDTEVVLQSLRAWGTSAFAKFRGMYSLALYDRSHETVLFARDPYGKKPLFIQEHNGDFFFSSEIKPLTEVKNSPAVFNLDALEDYLVDRYVPGPKTFFKGVDKLLPGHYAVWQNGRMSVNRFYVPPISTEIPTIKDYRAAVQTFSSVFDDAVRIRMRGDAPFGAFLSGGLDSTAVVATMVSHAIKPIRTFSVGFLEEEYSELSYAEFVSRHFETDHESIIVTQNDFFANWDDAIKFRGAPVSEPSDIPMMIMSRVAQRSVKAVLTGEGADEFLAGYPKHVAERYSSDYQRIVSEKIHDQLVQPAIEALPYSMHRLKILGKAFGQRDSSRRMRIWFGGLTQVEQEHLLGRKLSSRDIDKFPFSIQTNSNLRRSQFFDQTSWLPDNALERADRMMMMASLEGRMPFMDTELAALTARMPDDFLVHFGQGKRILRSAMRGKIPDEILKRKKNGFRVPIHLWFKGEQKGLVQDLLTSDQSTIKRLLDGKYVATLVEDHVSGRVNNERILWSLCNLEQFLRIYKPSISNSSWKAA